MTIRVFGIGSPSGDDQAGWLVVDALRAAGLEGRGIVVEKLDRPGAALVGLLEGTSHAILVDAMQGSGAPGSICRFGRDSWPGYRQGISSHGFGVFAALSLGQALGSLPPRLDLYGIEIASAGPGEAPGAAVQAEAKRLAARILAELGHAAR